MRTIVVTGGAGFIGSNLISHLMETTDHRIVNLDAVTYAADHRLLDRYIGHERYAFVKADIRDRAAMTALMRARRPDAVIHLAAESHVDRSVDSPLDFVETNVLGTANLLHAARDMLSDSASPDRERFRFIHVSTDEVFGSLGPTGAFEEETRYDPSSPYSASKAASDHLVRAWGRTFGLPVIVTNCSNNYGPRQFPEKLIPLMTIKALAGDPLPVYGVGANVRDWLHVRDHAAALAAVLERGRVGETYCIGGGAERANLQVVTAICDHIDAICPPLASGPRRNLIRFVADRPGHDLRYAVDATKIRLELGWSPGRSFEQGLRDTVDWYVENEAWWRPLVERGALLRRGRGS